MPEVGRSKGMYISLYRFTSRVNRYLQSLGLSSSPDYDCICVHLLLEIFLEAREPFASFLASNQAMKGITAYFTAGAD